MHIPGYGRIKFERKGNAASPTKKCGKGSLDSPDKGTLGGSGRVFANNASPKGQDLMIPEKYSGNYLL